MNGDVKTRSLDALAASTNHMLKAIKLDGCNALGADLKKRIRRNQATAADEELIEYIYWRNFWHITRTLSRQSRLIETFKVLLRQLEDRAPAHLDITPYRNVISAQLTHIEMTYFFFIALGFSAESELRELLRRSGVLKLMGAAKKSEIHTEMFNRYWGFDLSNSYLAGNPLALAKRTKPRRASRVTRFLPRAHWEAVQESILAMPTDTPLQAAAARRARWMFSLLYIGGLRASELCRAAMGDMFSRRSPDGTERWWLELIGKGEKKRLVPVTGELLNEAKRYRIGLELEPLPRPGEGRPLVGPIHGDPMQRLDRTTVYGIVKDVMKAAADHLRGKGAEFEDAARHIELASTHWMRHTSASHQTDHGDLKAVRDNLGHASVATTNIYAHTEDDQRHDQTSAVHRLSW